MGLEKMSKKGVGHSIMVGRVKSYLLSLLLLLSHQQTYYLFDKSYQKKDYFQEIRVAA